MYFVDADLSRINREALLISFEEVLIENKLLKNKIINNFFKRNSIYIVICYFVMFIKDRTGTKRNFYIRRANKTIIRYFKGRV
jgi:hypothetical protein